MGTVDFSGTTLGQYHLQEVLGMGGMGVVYRAFQANLQREVAIKVLPATLAQHSGYLERFEREAHTAAALEHAHIVPILDYGSDQGITYVVMRLLKGGSLVSRMEQHPTLPAITSISAMLQRLASALDYAHARGVVHRDIKPSNIMFDEVGNPYLVDFGIAKLAGAAVVNITEPGTMVGTPAFMAPEQWQNQEATPATDQYSLAVVVYAVLTGRLPFEADTPHAFMFQHIIKRPPSAHDMRRDIPIDAADVLTRALAKQPSERFSTVTAFAEAFDAALERKVLAIDFADTDIIPRRAIPDADATGMPILLSTRRWRWRALLLVVMLCLGVGLVTQVNGSIGLNQRTPPRPTTALPPNAELVQAPSPSATAALSTAEVQATINQEIVSIQDRAAQTEMFIQSQTAAIPFTVEAGTAARMTQTAAQWTPSQTPDYVQTAIQYTTQTAAVLGTRSEANKTMTATRWTQTPTPSNTPTPTRVPNSQVVGGVEMVEVPMGCFMMGSDEGFRDEQPQHEICFDAPFWIDRYEVTNAQFVALGGQAARESRWTDANRPRESVTWFEAAAFCALRGARLPTEAEWEYAARGPHNLRYPWGDTFQTERLVHGSNSVFRTWDVGSKPGGGSWIGAYDMAGNVWEWTGSLYVRYPFDANASRADLRDTTSYRSIRGGSWTSNSSVTRGASRGGYLPSIVGGDIGFRCARAALPDHLITSPTPDPATAHNTDWTPSFETFEGVEMVWVPSGCFMMGSTNATAEQPRHEQCFEGGFWLDRYEVTNAQFAAFGGQAERPSIHADPAQPRDSVTWFEARDFCALRGMRLPTEAEWEYAARGPDALAYPWGDDFEAAAVVYATNADAHSWAVGSKLNGVTWVGALDMAGNVWEWTSSLYRNYPYHANDGRELALDSTTFRTMRGGSWTSAEAATRTANRVGYLPMNTGADIGLRCARSG